MPAVWTPAMIAELTRLHAQVPEISFLEISKRLQAQGYPVTRNGCIGKARRLGLPLRDPIIVTQKNTARLRQAQRARMQRGPTMTIVAKSPDLQPMRPVYTEPRGIMLIDLEIGAECEWPLNDGGPFLFCGCAVYPGRPYCADHAARAYHPVRQR